MRGTMDYSDDEPERLWITQPDAHPDLTDCGECGDRLDMSHSVPVLKGTGGLCQECATKQVQDHPLTPTYLQWMENADPRWWSVWCCNCEGCVPDALPA